MSRRLSVTFLLIAAAALTARPQIDPAGIPGELLLCGPAAPAAAFDRFLQAAGDKARVVVLAAGKEDVSAPLAERAKKVAASVKVLSVPGADGKAPPLDDAAGVWLAGDNVEAMARALVGSPLEKALKGAHVVAASGPVVRLLARCQPDGKEGGCDLLPDAVVTAGAALPTTGPYLVGFQLGRGAALSVRGRNIRVIGEGKVGVTIDGTKGAKPRRLDLGPGAQEDLTALRRSARDRAEAYPPAKPGVPAVPKGTLVIVGGGGMPAGLVGRFVELAGGKAAKIVVLPTAMPDPLPKRDGIAEAFRKAGAKVTVLPGRTSDLVGSKEYVAALREATGVWFGGGRQWRFVDAYEGTALVPLMFDVLKRGGVIGGSSAGATIQGEYLARGGVFDNFAIRYEGYERGLGFLPGVAIDQHFAQRKRFKDMTALMGQVPQFLGIGLDEATAIVVRGSTAEVVGRGQAHFYDAPKGRGKDGPDHESLADGGAYDLVARKVIRAKK